MDCPDLAHLTFRVFVGDCVLGIASVPLTCLKQGLHCLNLFDENGYRISHSTLTIRSMLCELDNAYKSLYFPSPDSSVLSEEDCIDDLELEQKLRSK